MMKDDDILALHISGGSLVVLGLASLLVCHTNSYYLILGYFILYGVMDAGYITNQCTLVCRCVGPRNVSMAWGIFTMCFAVMITIGGPIAGE